MQAQTRFRYIDLLDVPEPHRFCFVMEPRLSDSESYIYTTVMAAAEHRLSASSCPQCDQAKVLAPFIIHPFLPPRPQRKVARELGIEVGLILTTVLDSRPEIMEIHPLRYHLSCPHEGCGWHRAAAEQPNLDIIPRVEELAIYRTSRYDPNHLVGMQLEIVNMLARDGPLTSTQVGLQLGKSRQSMANLLAYLGNKGYVVMMGARGRYHSAPFRLTTAEERAEILRKPRKWSFYRIIR